MLRFVLAMAILGGGGGCASAPDDGGADDLTTSLEADVGADRVRLVLHVTNSGSEPVVLEFGSAARYDFEILTAAGQKVWQWSDDQMFAQVMGTDTIDAGASRDYSAQWAPGGRTGSFIAVGRVVATNRPIEQRVDFRIDRTMR